MIQARKAIILLMVFGVLFTALNERGPSESNPRSPSLFSQAQILSITISELKYGLTGYRGFRKVHELFYPHFPRGAAGALITDYNKTIKQAMNLKDVESGGIHYGFTFSMGVVDYYKLSFILFGYKIESAFYLFALILIVSSLIFCISFYKSREEAFLFFILLLPVCGFMAIVRTDNLVFEGITHHVNIPIMSIIPSMHIALMVISKNRPSVLNVSCAIIQAAILIFVIFARTAGQYQLIFLASWLVFLILSNLIRRKAYLDQIRVWPLILVLIFCISLQSYKRVSYDEVYRNNALGSHPFWHNLYMGLAGHPESNEKYGIVDNSDGIVVELVKRKEIEMGSFFDAHRAGVYLTMGLLPQRGERILFGNRYEEIVKQEYFRILREDPWFIINAFRYKMKYYFQSFFRSMQGYLELLEVDPNSNFKGYLGGWVNMIEWYLIVVVAFGVYLVRNSLRRNWPLVLILFILQFSAALIPPILTYPMAHSVADSAIVLCSAIYLIFSIALCYFFYVSEKLYCRFFSNRVAAKGDMQ